MTRRWNVPSWVALLGVVATAFLALPVIALAVRAPWADVADLLTGSGARAALRLSLFCSLAATVLAMALGVPLAWIISRAEFPGRRLVRGLAILPLVLPPVVGGVALLLAFGREGVAGALLDDLFGFRTFGTSLAVILAEAFVALPFVVLAVEAGLRALDRRYEDAAASLGASPSFTMWRVTLPALRPALASAAILAWARALGEFGATITFAGNVPGRTQTAPLAIYTTLQHDLDGAIALSIALVVVALAVLLVLRDRWLTT